MEKTTRPFLPTLPALLIAAALALPLRPALAQDLPVDAAAQARLKALTAQVVGGIGEYRRAATAAQRSAASNKIRTSAAERKALMLATLEKAPGLVLRQALPAGLTANLPADVAALLEREVELTGVVSNVHADDMATRTCSDRFFLEASTEPLKLRLHAADKPDRPGVIHPAMQFTGERVTVRALRLDGQLLVGDAGAFEYADGTSTSTVTGTTATAAIAGAQNTLVIMGNFADKGVSCSVNDVHARVFGTSNSVHDLYRETSVGNVTFTGATYGPYTIAANSTDACDYGTWGTQLANAAAAQGINLSAYARKLYVLPAASACGFSGVANVGGTNTNAWVFSCGATDLMAHELGHNLTFRHASTPSSTYGDNSDVMGISGMALRQLNAPNKVRAGWIPSTHVRDVGASGTFTLSPTAAVNPPYPQALTLPKPDTSDSYYISLRQGIGYDRNLGSSYLNRVSVHRGTSSSMPTYLMAALGAGQSYTDATNGYTFTVNSIGTDSATVSVTVGAGSCARAAPGVSVTPITQSGGPGKGIGYSVTVTNNNSSACGTGTFAFTPAVPAGWTSSNSPATLSLGAGQSATSVWTVTSAASATPDTTYSADLTAYDAGATSSSRKVTASYIVVAADTTPPTVAITSPLDGTGGLSGTVTVAASAGDNVGVAKVEFTVNGALAATDTSAPYTFSWNTRKLSGSYTLGAVAVDAAGNRSAPASVTVTVGGSSTSGTTRGKK